MMNLEEMIAAMKVDQQHQLSTFKQEQDHQFSCLETLITSLVRGKAPS